MTPKETAEALRRKAQAILDWPLVETEVENGQTVLKPSRWSLSDAPKLLQLAGELEAAEPADFPAPITVQGQPQSRQSWKALQEATEKPAWWQDYLSIKEQFPHFKNWRIWVYIAWISQPQGTRQPATIEELAPQVLGCTSRAVRNWYKLDYGDLPTIAEAIAWAQAAPLLRSRREIYDALVSVAVMPDPKAHQDRKLALEMLGDYRQKQDVDVSMPKLPEILERALEQAYGDPSA